MSNSQRAYCFTSFEESKPIDDPKEVRWINYQEEICPTTGKHHFQGYAEFYRKVTAKTARKILGVSYVEKRFGTREEARDYCIGNQNKKPGDNSPIEGS